MSTFRVALSGDFLRPDSSPAYPMFDLSPLSDVAEIDIEYVMPCDGRMTAESLVGFDALILLAAIFDTDSIPLDGRLGLIARFGVGYDSVDLDACTRAGIGVVITPDGVRRPVAMTILTFVLALAGRLMEKNQLTREGSAGFAKRSDYMGVGLVGRTLGSLGVGNIGAETFRMCAPWEMNFLAHDPWADLENLEKLGVKLVDIETLFRESDFLCVNTPLTSQTHHIVNAKTLAM